MDIKEYISNCQTLVNTVLNHHLPPETTKPKNLHAAMRYAVLNGGKRLRSAFVLSIGEVLNADQSVLLDICAAVELIHAFSLIHDDLPALDNDELRHGKPTCHLAFGEATAIMAGDALHTLAFAILADIEKIPARNALRMVKALANSTGSVGMIGGETLDIGMVNKKVSVEEVEHMYHLKTGYILEASVILPAIAADCQEESVFINLKQFAKYIGISFQIHDDIIGIETDTETLGKKQNADLLLNKPTYPALVGLDAAKKRRDELYQKAMQCLKNAGCYNKQLEYLTQYLIRRNF